MENGLIRDCISGELVDSHEWIARELERVRANQQPRHCTDYEALCEVIEHIQTSSPPPIPSSPTVEFGKLVDALSAIVQYSIKYCDQSNPVKLVQALENINGIREKDGGMIKDTASAQQRLFSILFGNVQITAQLFQTWNVICTWAKHLLDANDWHAWMAFGLDAYIKAKSLDRNLDRLPVILQNTHLN